MSTKMKDLADKVRGWKLVQKTLPRIIEYGRSEGILQVSAVSPKFHNHRLSNQIMELKKGTKREKQRIMA